MHGTLRRNSRPLHPSAPAECLVRDFDLARIRLFTYLMLCGTTRAPATRRTRARQDPLRPDLCGRRRFRPLVDNWYSRGSTLHSSLLESRTAMFHHDHRQTAEPRGRLPRPRSELRYRRTVTPKWPPRQLDKRRTPVNACTVRGGPEVVVDFPAGRCPLPHCAHRREGLDHKRVMPASHGPSP